jgi:lipopolysaccharide transport system permease protein
VLIDVAVALAVSVGLMVYFRTPISPAILLLPMWLLLMVLFALGVGLVAAALTVTYRDVASGVRALLPFLQYISPVVYPISLVSAKLGPLLPLYYLNPMAVLVQGFRWSLVGGTMPPLGFIVYAAVYAAGVFLAGAFLFSRKEQTFADVI